MTCEQELRKLLGKAIRKCKKSRADIAKELGDHLGQKVTEGMLYGFTKDAGHAVRFPAAWLGGLCEIIGNDELAMHCLPESPGHPQDRPGSCPRGGRGGQLAATHFETAKGDRAKNNPQEVTPMPLAAKLELIPPLAEQLRDAGPLKPGCEPDWAWIDEHTASTQEMAAVWRCSEDTAYHRVARMPERFRMEVPSRKNVGKNETRVVIRVLAKSAQRAICKLRRNAESDAHSVADHPGGLVIREDDARLALTPRERTVVQGLYLKRSQPGPGHLMHILVRDCIRCHAAPMQQLVPGARGRYGQWRCMNRECGLEFNYRTILRICKAVPPEVATLARKGVNAWVNKHDVYRPQPASDFHRNEPVYGDHHELDVWSWDERDPARKLRRGLWFSAWDDKSTAVVEWRMAWRANADLLSLAFASYVRRWGVPEEAWTDNGKDYISAQFLRVCKDLGVSVHHTLPSKRTGESHGKSKPVERFFGTMERDFVQTLPGWCGSHPKERPDDVLWPMQKQHEAFAARKRSDTPFLSFQQIEKRIRAWTEQHFLITPSATADAAPQAAFTADSHPVKTVRNERVLDLLLWRAKTRVVGRNGVSVDGRMYWSGHFAGLSEMACTVRWDPGDIGQVVVSVPQRGKADQIIIATSKAWQDLAESNYERFREIKKDRLRIAREAVAARQLAAEGITPYDQMLMEAQANAEPMAAAVNGTPVITPGHHLARAIAAAPKPVTHNHARGQAIEGTASPVRLPVRLPDEQASPEALPFRMPDYVDEGRTYADEEGPPEGQGIGQED